MSGSWIVAVGALWLLVLALSVVLARLLRVVASQDRHLAILREKVGRLEARTGLTAAPAASRAAVVHLTFDPDCDKCRDLALDAQVAGFADLSIPVRVFVPDTPAGRELGAQLPGAVEYQRSIGAEPTPPGFPHALVLTEEGAVLAKGNPATVADLDRLIRA